MIIPNINKKLAHSARASSNAESSSSQTLRHAIINPGCAANVSANLQRKFGKKTDHICEKALSLLSERLNLEKCFLFS